MRLHVAAFFLMLLPMTAEAVGGFSHAVVMDPESRDAIEIRSFLDVVPSVGFYPLRVKIHNRSAEDRVWSMASDPFQSGYVEMSAVFPVKAGGVGEFEVMVPLKVEGLSYSWAASLTVRGPGVESGGFQLPAAKGRSGSATGFIAMSDALHAVQWGALASKVSEVWGGAVEVGALSADWRAYSGMDQLWMTAKEWEALAEDRRTAVLEWLAMGGELVLKCGSEREVGEVAGGWGREGVRWRHGVGEVRLVAAGGKAEEVESLVRAAPRRVEGFERPETSEALGEVIGSVRAAGPLVLIFIVVFGVVAGPVNLFVLAGPGRRHRLFVTTPLISLVGAAVLTGSILVQDGTGGTGARLVHVQLLPGEKRMVIQQEQVSRTGLLLGSGFRTEPVSWVQPVGREAGGMRSRFQMDGGGGRSGDWFQSRTEQAMVVMGTRPTRGAIEFEAGVGGAPPTVISAMEAELERLFVRDEAGGVWTASEVTPGRKVTMARSAAVDLRAFRKVFLAEMRPGATLGGGVKRTGEEAGTFVATAKSDEGLAVETLRSIRWRAGGVWVSGEISRGGVR